MSVRTCEQCGSRFDQFGRGRPAKRCHECRNGDRYGPAHRSLRAELVPGAVGRPCARCGQPLGPAELIDLGHVDGGAPDQYAGLEHSHCNRSSAASRGNAMRAAAYRAMRGLPPPAPTRVASNGTSVAVAEPLPARLDPAHQCHLAGCHADGVGSPCKCGSHSRVW